MRCPGIQRNDNLCAVMGIFFDYFNLIFLQLRVQINQFLPSQFLRLNVGILRFREGSLGFKERSFRHRSLGFKERSFRYRSLGFKERSFRYRSFGFGESGLC